MTSVSRYCLSVRTKHSQIFGKVHVLQNLVIFTGKHLCWSLFLIKLSGWRSSTLSKTDFNLVDTGHKLNVHKTCPTSIWTFLMKNIGWHETLASTEETWVNYICFYLVVLFSCFYVSAVKIFLSRSMICEEIMIFSKEISFKVQIHNKIHLRFT